MIAIEGGYAIEQFPKRNRIEIYLPQTWETLSNTVEAISSRKTTLTDAEMSAILAVVKAIMEGTQ